MKYDKGLWTKMKMDHLIHVVASKHIFTFEYIAKSIVLKAFETNFERINFEITIRH